jgi:hypothetical protein
LFFASPACFSRRAAAGLSFFSEGRFLEFGLLHLGWAAGLSLLVKRFCVLGQAVALSPVDPA